MLQEQQIIGHWPDIVLRNCLQNISQLSNLLTMVNGLLRGRTILPIPNDIEFLSQPNYLRVLSNKTFNRHKIRLLEDLIMTWKSQIQTAIDYDRDPPKSQSHPFPMVEIDFWIGRAENLRGIQRQVRHQQDENGREMCDLFD